MLTRDHGLLKARAGQQEATVRLEVVLAVIVGVQLAVVVGEALPFAGELVRNTPNEINKIVLVDVPRVLNAAWTANDRLTLT